MVDEDVLQNYQRHIKHEQKLFTGNLPPCFKYPDSIACWRYKRMLNFILPIVKLYPDCTWLTIGDGNYGTDAFFLKNAGAKAIASSISDITLKYSKELGYIDEFEVINAENIKHIDNSFDFVLCKESYHHFPRPPVAFYEMLRVAKKALILIEPQEGNKRIGDFLKRWIKVIIRKDKTTLFEICGNFIYRVRIKEVEKMLTALNFSCCIYKRYNDFYHPFQANANMGLSIKPLLTKIGIIIQDLLSVCRIINYGLCICIIFKNKPNENELSILSKNGFKIKYLPTNPFIE